MFKKFFLTFVCLFISTGAFAQWANHSKVHITVDWADSAGIAANSRKLQNKDSTFFRVDSMPVRNDSIFIYQGGILRAKCHVTLTGVDTCNTARDAILFCGHAWAGIDSVKVLAAFHADSADVAVFADSARIAVAAYEADYSDSSRIAVGAYTADSSAKSAYADSARTSVYGDSSRTSAYADSARIAATSYTADSSAKSAYTDSARIAVAAYEADYSDSSRIAVGAYASDSAAVAGFSDSTRIAVASYTSDAADSSGNSGSLQGNDTTAVANIAKAAIRDTVGAMIGGGIVNFATGDTTKTIYVAGISASSYLAASWYGIDFANAPVRDSLKADSIIFICTVNDTAKARRDGISYFYKK